MIIIAHRGNLHGISPSRENEPDCIEEAIRAGFHVEIDLRVYPTIDGGYRYCLGHDEPRYDVTHEWLKNDKLFIHCKNVEALLYCNYYGHKHYFSHDKDDVTLTSSGYFWTYPDNRIQLTRQSIPVVYHRRDPIWDYRALIRCAGVCTDDPFYYQSILEVADPDIYS